MANRFDIQAFARDPERAAQMVAAGELFSLMAREVTLPGGCAALLWGGSSQPRVARPGGTIASDAVREALFVRTGAFELSYGFERLASRDGYEHSAEVNVTVRVLPELSELKLFYEAVVGSRDRVTISDLGRHCEETVRAATARYVKSEDAATLADPAAWIGYDDVLADGFKPLGFSSGLGLGADPRIVLSSSVYENAQATDRARLVQREREEAERRRQAAAAEVRREHLAKLGDMLEQVRAMADASGALDVQALVRTFDPAQRGRLYHGLMAIAEPQRKTQALLVVAGGELLWLDPAAPHEPARRLKLPQDAGALRSVRLVEHGGRRRILVGARHGVHVLGPDGDLENTYVVNPTPEVRGGVNAAVIVGRHLYATHSEVGLIEWPLDTPESHALRLTDFTEGSGSVRDVQSDNGRRLWVAVDDLVVGWTPGSDGSETALQAGSEVTALAVAEGYVFAGLKGGSIVRWVIGGDREPETIRTDGATVKSLSWLSGGGVPRLLVGDGRQYLTLHVVGDNYHGEYRCLHRVRWGFAGEDLVVGVDETRAYLFTWPYAEPDLPGHSVSIRRMTGRSIQDVALLPADARSETA